MTKNPILRAAVLSLLPDLPPSATARKPGSGQVSQIVGSRGQELVLDRPVTTIHNSEDDTIYGKAAKQMIVDDPHASQQRKVGMHSALGAPYGSVIQSGANELKPDENGVVQYVTAQDEMYMACRWLCSLSEEDCAQVLPILHQIKEAYVEAPVAAVPK